MFLLLSSLVLVLMATASDSKTQRVKEIIAFIRSQNLSLNEFLTAFYSSQDPSLSRQRGCSLTQSKGSRFTPEDLIDLWLTHCPPGGWSYLEGAIINRAGNIIIRETDKACKLDSLRVPTTKIEANDLDEGFLLAKLEGEYRETLPYLWMLLTIITTSWNRSEKWRDKPSASKESRAKFVRFSPSFT